MSQIGLLEIQISCCYIKPRMRNFAQKTHFKAESNIANLTIDVNTCVSSRLCLRLGDASVTFLTSKGRNMKYIPQYDLFVDDDCVVYRRSTQNDHVKCHLVQAKFYQQYNGYMRSNHVVKGKAIHAYIHRVIALAFVPNPYGYDQVDHINGNKLDNRPENLQWVSAQANCRNRKSFKLGSTPEENEKLEKRRARQRDYYRRNKERIIAQVVAYDRKRQQAYYAKLREEKQSKLLSISVPTNSEVA